MVENITNPVEGGVITNFDNIELLWHNTFYNELRVAPEGALVMCCVAVVARFAHCFVVEHPVVFTEKVWNTPEAREKTATILFETCELSTPLSLSYLSLSLALYQSTPLSLSLTLPQTHYLSRLFPCANVHAVVNIPGMLLASDAALSMYAAGRTTGLTVNCGHNVTSAVPVYEGITLPPTPLTHILSHTCILLGVALNYAAVQAPYGGHTLAKQMIPLLEACIPRLNSFRTNTLVEEFKVNISAREAFLDLNAQEMHKIDC